MSYEGQIVYLLHTTTRNVTVPNYSVIARQLLIGSDGRIE